MPNALLKQKNVLIVPLSLFVKINTKLPENTVDELLSSDEEKKALKKFNVQLEAILKSQLVTDFNLGKYTPRLFLLELLKFLDLTPKHLNKFNIERIEILKNTMESAWNALIEFNSESNELFNRLIKLIHQGKSIYFVANTNLLHTQKILTYFINFPFNNVYIKFLEKLPKKPRAEPLAISQLPDPIADNVLARDHGALYFCLSYYYNTLIEPPQSLLTALFKPSPSNLLTQLKNNLNDIGKTRDDILFVMPYTRKWTTKRLDLDTIQKEDFFTLLKDFTTTDCVNILRSQPSF